MLAIAYLAFAPLAEPPGLGWDKSNHLLAFFALAALADVGWPGARARPWRLGLVLSYGLFIELVQAGLDYRQGSVLDFAADVLGVALWLGLKQATLSVLERGRAASGSGSRPGGRAAGDDSPAGGRHRAGR
jgi:VanZ family protein